MEEEGGWEKGGGGVDNLFPLRAPHVLEEEEEDCLLEAMMQA